MADGDSKSNFSEMMGAVVKPIGDELGKMFEVGSQSVTGSADPQVQAQKEQEEQQKKAEDAKQAAYLKDYFVKLSEEEQKGRQATKQRDQEYAGRQAEQAQQDQAKQAEEAKKEQVDIAVQNAATAREAPKGVGG